MDKHRWLQHRKDAPPTLSKQMSKKSSVMELPQFVPKVLTSNIYHQVEDAGFEAYMNRLFGSVRNFVIVYSSDYERSVESHVRHRKFSDFIDTN